MKIKSKIGNHIQTVTPQQWGAMKNAGTASEFDVIEQNTIWAEALSAKDKKTIGGAREFEMEHWENMLKQGHKLLWKRVEHKSTFQQ